MEDEHVILLVGVGLLTIIYLWSSYERAKMKREWQKKVRDQEWVTHMEDKVEALFDKRKGGVDDK